jgi:predicted amidophosphoribosyltransferase
MQTAKRTAALVREYLFPGGCALCGTMLLDREDAWYGLCGPCRARLPAEEGPRCASCGRPLISEQERCLPCREGEAHSFDGAWALYPYTGKYRELLRAYKFGRDRPLGNFFAEALVEALARFSPPDLETFTWVPVPPRPGKIKTAGWDQIAYLSRRLAGLRRSHCPHDGGLPGSGLLSGLHESGPRGGLSSVGGPLSGLHGGGPCLPVYPCLKRLPSKSQKKLNRKDRMANLRGRIRCIKEAPSRVILFDDVITTGATLDACAAALKEGGAERVYALCLVYD